MAADTEECCICLSALSSAPVVALLQGGHGSAVGRRACRHYLHAGCVTGLSPAKCPLCREHFTQTSGPISASSLQANGSQAVVAGLLRMLGETGGHAPTPAVLELLAATLPVPTAELWRASADLGCSQHVGLKDLEILFARYGRPLGEVDSPQLQRALSRLPVLYSRKTRLVRRLRWLALKFAGALGAGLHVGSLGAGAGLIIGCLSLLVPDAPSGSAPFASQERNGTTWSDVLDDWFEDPWDADDVGGLNMVVLAAVLLVALLMVTARLVRRLNSGVKPRDLLLRCGRWGAVVGLLVGWSHALGAVDPDDHGPRSVFVAGLLGETTWRRVRRGPGAARLGRVDVFSADRCYRI